MAIQVLYKHFRGRGVWGHAYFAYLGGAEFGKTCLYSPCTLPNNKNNDKINNNKINKMNSHINFLKGTLLGDKG